MFNTLKWKLFGQTIKTKSDEYFDKMKIYFTRERLMALQMIAKMVGLVVLTVFIPTVGAVSTLKAQKIVASAPIQVTLDTNTYLPVTGNKQVAFEVVESEAMRQAREAAVQLASTRTVVVREVSSAPVDPDLGTKRALAQRAASVYGVPWQILEAVWQVESGKSWDTSRGSSAGARGPMQFMPGTWRAYGQDGNGDGNRDVTSAEDALYGAANLLAANGAASGDIYRALLNYNHSDAYVQKVLGVAYSIGF